MKKTKILLVGLFIISSTARLLAQNYNNNPRNGLINHNVPKSPESSSFEKYGNIPIGEFTGTASIGIPLYDLKGKELDVPISLSYHASGIKVAQEATWVGLGWDLVPGGRITLQIKGGYDRYTDQYYQGEWGAQSQSMVNYLKNQVGAYTTQSSVVFGCTMNPTSSGNPILPTYHDPSYICNLWLNHPNFSRQDLWSFLYLSAKYASLEPDMYNLNFLGRSLSFYKEPFTGKIIIKNENYHYRINEINNGGGSIGWEVIDDLGVKYIFQQEEKTHYLGALAGLYPEITTSWLLTQITSVNGETINFTYANFGIEIAAPNISESKISVTGGFANESGYSETTNRNDINDVVYQRPQYLQQIESKNALITFDLGYRTDIGGLGTRKLDGIKIKSKLTNQTIRHIKFNYEYFGSTTSHPMYYNTSLIDYQSHGSTSVAERMHQRLKLNSVDISGPEEFNGVEKYRFLYNPTLLPNKVSLAQDHWGYFNNVNNINVSATAVSFTPSLVSLVDEGLIPYPYPPGTDINLSGNANRAANEQYAQAAMLTSVIYPTGGFTNFEYELHRSGLNNNKNFKGGGLRIKQLSNFTGENQPEKVTIYEYLRDASEGTIGSGIYLGNIDYSKASIDYEDFNSDNNYGGSGSITDGGRKDRVTRTMFSNGNLNVAGSNVGYAQVRVKSIDYLENKQSTVVKKFQVRSPWPANTGGPGVFTEGAGPLITESFVIVPGFLYQAPTPDTYLEGKLMEEDYLDNSGARVKRIKNHYKQHLIKDEFYSVKVINSSMTKDGRQNLFFHYAFEPVRSFFTTLDSTTVENFNGSDILKEKTQFLTNSSYQIEKTIRFNSDQTATVNYTTTPLSYLSLPTLPQTSGLTGNALSLQEMKIRNLINLPVEKLNIKRNADQSEHVIDGSYLKYDFQGNILDAYMLQNAQPIPIGQFVNTSYNSGVNNSDLVKDSRYVLEQSASYTNLSKFPKEVNSKGRYEAFIFDNVQNVLNAKVINAKYQDIAYSSFESAETGNWIINGGTIDSQYAHTGKNSLVLSGGNSISAGISTGGNYIVSYWLKSGSINVNGTNPAPVQTINGWTYFEHTLSLGANNSVTIVGDAIVDELRLYPSDANFTSFTYEPLIGVSSSSDTKSLTNYFEYDQFNRLKNVLNGKREIIKSYGYNYTPNISAITPTGIYFNDEITVSLPKQCPSGQTGSSVPYTVPANRYYSFLGKAAANQLAQDDINANAQNNANNLGTCGTTPVRPTFSLNYSFQTQGFREFQIAVTDAVSGLTEYYYVNSNSSGTLSDIPGGTGSISINELNYVGTYNFSIDSSSQNGVYVVFSPMTMGGNMNLYIIEQ